MVDRWVLGGSDYEQFMETDASGQYVLHSDYAALEARVDKLEKDAARYNWIMDYDDFEEVIEVLSLGSDDAIDRAMGREA